MKLRIIVYALYEYFVKRLYNLDEYSHVRSENADITVTNFLIEVHKKIGLQSIGPLFIYRYLVFQFDYWRTKNVEFGDKVSMVKVFGKKSFERYVNRSTDFSWYNAELNLKKYHNIDKLILRDFESRKIKNFSSLVNHEEVEKLRFFNTNEGLKNCLDNTTLFNNKSTTCLRCSHQQLCKKLLQKNHIGIYTDRGYARKATV